MGQYIDVIRQAAVIFPAIAVIFTVPYIAYNYHKYGSILSMRILIVYSFILYMICVYCLVILPLPTGEAAEALQGHQRQLIPGHFIADIVKDSQVVWSQPKSYLTLLTNRAVLTNVFNIFMTLPFGIYLRYYFQCSWKKTVCLSFFLSLFFELTQLSGLYFIYPGSYRLFDVDDLIMNTTGGMVGYAIAGPVSKLLPAREDIDHMSYVRGQKVSVFRRFVALIYDIVFGSIFYGVIEFMIRVFGLSADWFHYSLGVMLYFMLAPVLFRGSTIGQKLTKLKLEPMEGKEAHWYRYPIRYAWMFLIFNYVPFGIAELASYLLHAVESSRMLVYVLLLIGYGAFGFFLLFEFIRMAMHKQLFYERWSGTKIASTVVEK